jgi:hypothetical protein
MRLTTLVPRALLYVVAKLNGARVGNSTEFWNAPKLALVTLTAKDQGAMDHVLDSCRLWAACYEPPTVTSALDVSTAPLVAFQACSALCQRSSYPQE